MTQSIVIVNGIENGSMIASDKEADTMMSDKTVKKTGILTDEVVEHIMGESACEIAKAGSKHRPKKTPLEDLPCVRSDAEIAAFQKRYKRLIWSACTAAGMPAPSRGMEWGDSDREEVLNEILLMVATGTLGYDPSKGAKESTYVFSVAKNMARELYRRRCSKRQIELTDEEWATIGERRRDHRFMWADAKLVFREALVRLAKECRPDALELLVRYVLVEKPYDPEDPEVSKGYRSRLANEYGYASADAVSVVQNRWFGRLMAHAKNVAQEDMRGQLKLSHDNGRISHLKPFLEWL